MKNFVPALPLLLLVPASPAHSAEGGAPDFASTVASTTSQVEEVIVSGRLDSLSQLRKALDRAENRVYERYNEINKGSDYDIECITEAPIGSRQKVKRCQPRYVSDAMHEDAFDALFRNQNSATRLRSEAMPRPAMSNAVPWSGLVRTKGRPSVTLTPSSTPRYFTGIRPWSCVIATTASNSPGWPAASRARMNTVSGA